MRSGWGGLGPCLHMRLADVRCELAWVTWTGRTWAGLRCPVEQRPPSPGGPSPRPSLRAESNFFAETRHGIPPRPQILSWPGIDSAAVLWPHRLFNFWNILFFPSSDLRTGFVRTHVLSRSRLKCPPFLPMTVDFCIFAVPQIHRVACSSSVSLDSASAFTSAVFAWLPAASQH